MRNIWVIAQKEFKSFFISPVAYAIVFAVLLILGIIFYGGVMTALFQQQYVPAIDIVLGPLTTLFLFMMPAVTMRTLADEQKNGTLELLLTSPVRDWEVVVGKWLGCMFFIITLLLITWIYPLILNQIVKPGIDQGLMAAGYLGILLFASALLAIGVMMSGFFSNQIAAFFATLVIFLVLWMLSYPLQAMGPSGGSEVLRYLDLYTHYSNFSQGIVQIKDVVYYLSVTALALFLGSAWVETRRWR